MVTWKAVSRGSPHIYPLISSHHCYYFFELATEIAIRWEKNFSPHAKLESLNLFFTNYLLTYIFRQKVECPALVLWYIVVDHGPHQQQVLLSLYLT